MRKVEINNVRKIVRRRMTKLVTKAKKSRPTNPSIKVFQEIKKMNKELLNI